LLLFSYSHVFIFFVANVFGTGEGGDFHHPPRRRQRLSGFWAPLLIYKYNYL